MTSGIDLKQLPDGITFKVRVQPRSSKKAVSGVIGDCVKISLTSPPVDGEANSALIVFIADFFSVAKSNVEITSGLKNRTKIVKVTGINKEKFFSLISDYI